MDNKIYWIWLQLALGPASTMYNRLLEYFDNDLKKIYNADLKEYRAAGVTPKRIARLSDKSLDEAQRIIDWCKDKKVGILCYDDQRYPKRLKSIPDAPIVLYYIGELYNFDDMLCLGAVGTRKMSKYGHDTAYSFCYDLARQGAVVVSGLASGIDTTSHRAVLDAGGRTVAVIGCRINKVYPAENREIMREIARKGLLMTEYHPFFKTQSINFPQRNRIISGLCQGTIVFEADSRSGSLITARRARAQGRKVYALPGKIGEKGALGTNELIQDGATLITRVNDILCEYEYSYNLKLSDNRVFDYSPVENPSDSYGKPKNDKIMPITDGLQKQIYDMLSTDTPLSVELIKVPGYEFGEILSAITMLQLADYVIQHPGNTLTKK